MVDAPKKDVVPAVEAAPRSTIENLIKASGKTKSPTLDASEDQFEEADIPDDSIGSVRSEKPAEETRGQTEERRADPGEEEDEAAVLLSELCSPTVYVLAGLVSLISSSLFILYILDLAEDGGI